MGLQLKVSASALDVCETLPCVINEFVDISGEIEVVIFASDNYPLFDGETCDISIGEFEENAPLIEQTFFRNRTLKFYATRRYLEEAGTPKKLDELEGHYFFLPAYREDVPDSLFLNSQIISTSNNYSVLLKMAIDSFGIALAPSDIVENDPEWREKLVDFLPNVEFQKKKLYIKTKRFLNPTMHIMTSKFLQVLKNEPESDEVFDNSMLERKKYQYTLKRMENMRAFELEGTSGLLQLSLNAHFECFDSQEDKKVTNQMTINEFAIKSDYPNYLWLRSRECRELVFYGCEFLVDLCVKEKFQCLRLKLPKQLYEGLSDYEKDLLRMALQDVCGLEIKQDNQNEVVIVDVENISSSWEKFQEFLCNMQEIFPADYGIDVEFTK